VSRLFLSRNVEGGNGRAGGGQRHAPAAGAGGLRGRATGGAAQARLHIIRFHDQSQSSALTFPYVSTHFMFGSYHEILLNTVGIQAPRREHASPGAVPPAVRHVGESNGQLIEAHRASFAFGSQRC
jgi:hypothetical protein